MREGKSRIQLCVIAPGQVSFVSPFFLLSWLWYNMVSITCWNTEGAILTAKGSRWYWNRSLCVLIVRRSLHSSNTRICKYESEKSDFAENVPLFSSVKRSLGKSKGILLNSESLVCPAGVIHYSWVSQPALSTQADLRISQVQWQPFSEAAWVSVQPLGREHKAQVF